MLEWKPKLVLLVVMLVLVAAMMGLSLLHLTGLVNADLTMYSW